MPRIIANGSCCGMKEFYALSRDPKASLWLLRDYRGYNLFLISDRVNYRNGTKLVAYIKRHKLGSVIQSKKVNNPVHGSTIQAWFFTPNWKNCTAWLEKYPQPKSEIRW